MPENMDVLTLVLPLRKKESIDLADFYDYWLDAHVTMPPRYPGIDCIWLHRVSWETSLWPQVSGVSSRPEPEDEFHGVPEATFTSFDGLAAFQGASGLQMDDGINFLGEQIAYRSLSNSRTLVDLTDPAPYGGDDLVRHLLFIRRRPTVDVDAFRAFITERLAPAWAQAPEVLKVRTHLLEEVELTLDHPGVRMFKPLELQYQAMVEVVVADTGSLQRFSESPEWTATAAELAEACEAVHAARDEQCITTKFHGQITLEGVRGISAGSAIRRLDAANQWQPALVDMFLPQDIPLYVP